MYGKKCEYLIDTRNVYNITLQSNYLIKAFAKPYMKHNIKKTIKAEQETYNNPIKYTTIVELCEFLYSVTVFSKIYCPNYKYDINRLGSQFRLQITATDKRSILLKVDPGIEYIGVEQIQYHKENRFEEIHYTCELLDDRFVLDILKDFVGELLREYFFGGAKNATISN